MFTHRINLLCSLIIFGLVGLHGQTLRRQQTRDSVFNRGINTRPNIRFISQPITTKPTEFFQQQQPNFRPQHSDFTRNNLGIVNQNSFRKPIPQTNFNSQQFQPNIPNQSQDIPVNQQQNFFEESSDNFNVPEQQPIQHFSQQQFNEPFQGNVPQEQTIQQVQTFERLAPQQKGFSRSRPVGQSFTVRRPVNRPQVTTFVTHNNPRPQETPESIIRSLTNVQEPVRGTQDVPLNQNNNFEQQEQSEFTVPVTRTNVRQRQRTKPSVEDEESVREQALNAKYSFSSEVNDGINDNNHIRAETRDGLKLSGVYSYSDGYFKRTVHYEADENGYRIVKEDNEPIGNGPNTDPTGTADIAANVGGANIQYSIRGEEVPAQFFTERNSRSERQLLQKAR